MSKQVNFYLNSTDTLEFDRFIRELEDVVIIAYHSSTKDKPVLLKDTIVSEMGSNTLGVFLTNKASLAKVEFKKPKTQNHWIPDTLTSPVVEYSRCFENKKFVRRGRLYFIHSYWNANKKLIQKNSKFVEWADKLLVRTKQSLMYNGNGSYLGKSTFAAVKNGLELRQI